MAKDDRTQECENGGVQATGEMDIFDDSSAFLVLPYMKQPTGATVITLHKLQKWDKYTKLHKTITALTEVLDSLCLYHKQQLQNMLQFLTQEWRLCSKSCNTNKKTTTANIRTATRHCVSSRATLKRHRSDLHLPTVSVCLKDLRLTCPNIALGTVKLDSSNNIDSHLHSSDQLTNNKLARARKKCSCHLPATCGDLHSSSKRRKTCGSSSPLLSVHGDGTYLQETTVDNPPSLLFHTKDKRCKNTLGLSLISKKQESRKGTFKGKESAVLQNLISYITKNTGTDPEKSDTVLFRNLIKHLLNKSSQNGFSFTEVLNQYVNSTKTKVTQPRLRNPKKKVTSTDSSPFSLSRHDSLQIKRELYNLMEAYSKNNTTTITHTKNSSNLKLLSDKKRDCGALVIENCGNNPVVNAGRRHATELPHQNLKVRSKSVNCSEDDLSLPSGLLLSPAPQNAHVKENAKSSECFGNYKICPVSQKGYFVQNAHNLFCKCTSKKMSGMFKDLKISGLEHCTAADGSKNAHLQVIVERLKYSIQSTNKAFRNNHTSEEKIKIYPSRSKRNASVVKSAQGNGTCDKTVLLRPLNHVKKITVSMSNHKDNINKMSVPERNWHTTAASETHTLLNENRLCSPIKIMFVSKVDGTEGVKYTLSSVYTSSNKSSKSLEKSLEYSDDIREEMSTDDCSQSVKSVDQCFKHQLSEGARQSDVWEQYECIQKIGSRDACFESGEPRSVSPLLLKPIRRPRGKTQKLKTTQNVNEVGDLKSSITLCNRNSGTRRSGITVSIKFGTSTLKRRIFKINSPCVGKNNFNKLRSLPGSPDKISKPNSDHVRTTRSHSAALHLRTSEIHQTTGRLSRIKKSVESHFIQPQEKNVDESNTVLHCLRRRNIRKPNLPCSSKHKASQKTFYNSRSARICQLSNQPESSNGPSMCPRQPTESLTDKRHRSKESYLNKVKVHNGKLKNKKLCEPHLSKSCLRCMECYDNTLDISVESIFQPNTVLKWWAPSSSNESLIQDLDSKYEQIINTWHNENDNEIQSYPSCDPQQGRSLVQMLFQKKCNINDVSTWFMQTTETKTLSILPKANARNPLEITNNKGTKMRKKHANINSSHCRREVSHCMQQTPSEELGDLSTFARPESCIVKYTNINEFEFPKMCNLSNLQSGEEKRVCTREILEEATVNVGTVTEKCTFVPKETTPSIETTLQYISHDELELPNGLNCTTSTPTVPCRKPNELLEKEKMARQTRTDAHKNKKDFKCCTVSLTKLKTAQGNYSSLEERNINNATEQNKCTLRSYLNFTVDYSMEEGAPLTKRISTTLKAKNSLHEKPGKRMGLRKCRNPIYTKPGPSMAWILERRKNMKRRRTRSVCRKTSPKKSKVLTATRKMEIDHSKFKLGPLKPVRFPSPRGSKDGMFSLTPIRIPHHGTSKGPFTGLPVSKPTTARWSTETIKVACNGIGLVLSLPVKAHSIGAMSVSWAEKASASLEYICKAAPWSSVNTFIRLDIFSESEAFGHKVLQAVVSEFPP
ncbi:uncharacterized protein RCH25_053205 [Pelodytes ibericus]